MVLLIEKSRIRLFRFAVVLILLSYLTFFAKIGAAGLDMIDSIFQELAQLFENGLFNHFFSLVSWLASPSKDVIWMIVIMFFLWGFKYKIQALWGFGLIIGADALGFILKHFVARDRPTGHLAADTGFSFPSGHVLGTFCLMAVIWLIVIPNMEMGRRRTIALWASIIWLILVMWSRVYLQAHYPSDTWAAVGLGYLWLQVMEWLYVALAPRFQQIKFLKNSYL